MNVLSQGENFKCVFLPKLAHMKKLELLIPWWLENFSRSIILCQKWWYKVPAAIIGMVFGAEHLRTLLALSSTARGVLALDR